MTVIERDEDVLLVAYYSENSMVLIFNIKH